MHQRNVLSILVTITLSLGALGVRIPAAQAQAGDGRPDAARPDASANTLPESFTDQIIVRYKDSAQVTEAQAASTDRVAALSAAAGVALDYFRPMSGDAHVLKLPTALPDSEVAQIAARLAASPEVEYAEPDSRMFPMATPNDPQYGSQWHYSAPVAGSYGANLPAAWDITTGLVTMTVAVLDTGILFDHPDLTGRTVPGYDMISDIDVANDGDLRDSNAADPGDWITAGESGTVGGPFEGCPVDDSSWHGSHVAGTIGAATNNSTGVAGINWNSRILPVRVLGKCGGFLSDIADGITWAAGLSVSGVPANPNPARVINMSLGGSGACGSTYQTAIDAATTAGTLVVVAAGNSNASGFRPANCNNVLTVAANNRNGGKASYSNFGAVVEIAAPGGETFPTGSNGVLSTLNAGLTSPAAHNYVFYQGTSMATPHVAGVASLVLSVNPSLTPAQVINILTSTATAFPGGSTCNTSLCGTGILNAHAAVLAAGTPLNNKVYLPMTLKDFSSACNGPANGSIQNAGFESGLSAWTEFSSGGFPIILNSFAPSSVTPRTGSWGAWLGGADNEIGYIQQSVTVGCSQPYLAFWNFMVSGETQAGFDTGAIQINGATVTTVDFHTGTNTGGWANRVVDLSAYRGQTVTLRVQIATDSSVNTNWFLDDFGFQSTP